MAVSKFLISALRYLIFLPKAENILKVKNQYF